MCGEYFLGSEKKSASQRKAQRANGHGKRSLVTDENRPKMKSSVQIVCAIGEWNFNFLLWLLIMCRLMISES
jgi:hypothetical protein